MLILNIIYITERDNLDICNKKHNVIIVLLFSELILNVILRHRWHIINIRVILSLTKPRYGFCSSFEHVSPT